MKKYTELNSKSSSACVGEQVRTNIIGDEANVGIFILVGEDSYDLSQCVDTIADLPSIEGIVHPSDVVGVVADFS